MMITVPIFSIAGTLLLYPFSFKVRYGFYRQWGVMVLWLLKVLCRLDFEVHGKNNIPNGASIIFCKHQSAWETIALQSIFPPQVWVLKHELIWVPFFGWSLAQLESVAIARGSGRKAVSQIVEQGTDRLKKGRCVVVFPEGTRIAPGLKKKYGIGGSILAERSGFPVVPVAHNAGEYWPRRGLIKKPGTIKVVIGKPIDSSKHSATQINELAKQWIDATVDEISTLKPIDAKQLHAEMQTS